MLQGRRKLTNGRRFRCASGEKARDGNTKRRPILDVHDVKQPDASAASSSHAVAGAPARARDSDADCEVDGAHAEQRHAGDNDVDETDFEGLVSVLRTMRSLLPLRRRGGPPPVSLDFSSALAGTDWASCWNPCTARTRSRASHTVDRAIVRWRRRERRYVSVQST